MKAWVCAVFLGVAAIVPAGAALACSKPAGASAIEAELVAWINAERGKKGLAALDNDSALGKAAQRHACDMATKSFLSHDGSDGSTMGSRVRGAGYKYKAAVENVGMDPRAPSARAIGESWKASSGHWKNLMDRRLDDMGVGFAMDGNTLYYVFVGAKKL